jgi:hypothetical protein
MAEIKVCTARLKLCPFNAARQLVFKQPGKLQLFEDIFMDRH